MHTLSAVFPAKIAPTNAPPEQRAVIISFSLLVTGLLLRESPRYTSTPEIIPVSYPKSRPAIDAVRAASHTNQLTGKLSMLVAILSTLASIFSIWALSISVLTSPWLTSSKSVSLFWLSSWEDLLLRGHMVGRKVIDQRNIIKKKSNGALRCRFN
jgi:hypothetical protein